MLSALKATFIALILLLSNSLLAQTNSFTLADWPATPAALKPVYVKAIMEQAGIHQVSFTREASFYVEQLDKFAQFAQEQNYHPYLLKTSVAQNLATIAVIHCDWNNGVAPWEFAQKYLGDEQLALLQPLYASAIARLKEDCK